MIKFSVPLPVSVNHCYFTARNGQRILTSKAKAWMEEAWLIARGAMREQNWTFSENEKLILELWAFYPDKRRRDLSNYHKLVCDCLEGVLFKDDKFVLVRDMDFEVDRNNPRLDICVYVKEE